jgi:hypothetical protein
MVDEFATRFEYGAGGELKRDSETELDYFDARYCTNLQGRLALLHESE